jgi:thimet oligopeptidase
MGRFLVLLAVLFTFQLVNADEQYARIRSDYQKGDITRIFRSAVRVADERINAIVALKPEQRNFTNTVLALEYILDELSYRLNGPSFMSEVHVDAAIRQEAEDAAKIQSQFMIKTFARKDLYEVLKSAHAEKPLDQELVKSYVEGFEEIGINLDDAKRAELIDLQKRLSDASTEFSANIAKSSTKLTFTREQLKGVPENELQRMTHDNQIVVTTSYPDVNAVMSYAESSDIRKQVSVASDNKGGEKNLELLKEILAIRKRIAEIRGYPSWAHLKIRPESRMAKAPEKVSAFLEDLTTKLQAKGNEENAELLVLKKELDPTATQVDPWDIGYLTRILKQRRFNYDPQEVEEYFPADKVVEGIFSVYSQLLGVKFEEVKNEKVWADGVRFFKIIDIASNKMVASFYADLYPREGKYSHAAAFTLVQGRRTKNGYRKPVSAIVANFSPASGDRPALLKFGEVETFFHEFGHIMHQTLTQAKYPSSSGTSVARDFVEAPSQMLENWVIDTEVLKRISGHYKTGEPLPPRLVKVLKESNDFRVASFTLRQLTFAQYDVGLHLPGFSKDPVEFYREVHEKVNGFKPTQESHFPSSFGHLMGYDAGYYGYLWSDVIARAMFERFKAEGLLNAKVGMDYRHSILENGGTYDASDLVSDFLGHEATNDAFYKSLGCEAALSAIKK